MEPNKQIQKNFMCTSTYRENLYIYLYSMYEKCSSISTNFSAQNTWKVKLHGAIAMSQCYESLRMTKLTQNTEKIPTNK